MSEEQFIQHFQAIHAQMTALHGYMMPLLQGNTEQIGYFLNQRISISVTIWGQLKFYGAT
jgi:hypothetical protein